MTPASVTQSSTKVSSDLLVLVVDDEPTTRLLLRVAMQKEGFRVIEASDGIECLTQFKQHRPDIVLMDAVMPNMDGFSCCAALQKIAGDVSVPVLMITSLDDSTSVDRVFEVGAADYAAKPIHWALLRQRVRGLRNAVKHQQAERQIEASLREKEALLREVHHRVKNNLQIISSLLNLQASAIEDKEIAGLFRESQDRVRLMALIHEKLYQSDDLGKINLGDYIRDLTRHLMRSYEINLKTVDLNVEIDDIFLGTDTAVSCGLIINELFSNSLKYAFPAAKAGVISITATMTDDERFSISYADNGIGLPQALDIQNAETLGLQLVSSLCEQLEGDLEIQRSPGTAFNFRNILLSR
ncbi:MAG: histidine kinase dimerization/phosphoacceptor domain -containing protein [Phormidesmis sp.]